MKLPAYVTDCLDRLEGKGFTAYCVGGCVRDLLLGLTPHDYDLCTDATPAEVSRIFDNFRQIHAGEKHGTVGILTDGGVVEITTFRTESGYGDNRHPDSVTFVRNIEADLARRDFTVNAMAYAPKRGLKDPFFGAGDLKNHTLRAVGDPVLRFQEDSLRILRGLRFSAGFGLQVEEKTLAAMMSQAHLMDNLARERVFEELCKLLPLINSTQLCQFAPILAKAIPELTPMLGFDQRTPHHAYDVFTHTAYVVEAVPATLPLRWAALLHDVGKPAAFTLDENGRGHFKGHAAISAQMADEILLRLKAPTALRERVIFLIAHHMDYPQIDKKWVRRRLSRCGSEAFLELLQLQTADFGGKGVTGEDRHFAEAEALTRELLAEEACLQIRDLAVKGGDLMALGITGPALGRTLEYLLEQVLDEQLPNEKPALLNAVKHLEETL